MANANYKLREVSASEIAKGAEADLLGYEVRDV